MRKGQAALEFLTTYGWAFLTILIAIAALAYFGVLSPAKLLPERCSFPPEFECRDFRITETATPGQIQLEISLINVNDRPINITGANVDLRDNDVTTGPSCTPLGDQILSAGEKLIYTCQTTGNFAPDGSKQKLGLNMTYIEMGGDFVHNALGEIIATVQPQP